MSGAGGIRSPPPPPRPKVPMMGRALMSVSNFGKLHKERAAGCREHEAVHDGLEILNLDILSAGCREHEAVHDVKNTKRKVSVPLEPSRFAHQGGTYALW